MKWSPPNASPFALPLQIAMTLKPLLLAVGISLSVSALQAAAADFNRDIRPLLSDRCFSCHGPDAEHREAELRLDQLDSALEDRGGYQVVKPGSAENSELIDRIYQEDPDLIMPPPDMGKPLSPKEKELLREWIQDGAQWSEHWAYVPPANPLTPKIKLSERHKYSNSVDAFIAKRLREAEIDFSPQADIVTLGRRISFDLIGLPPSSEQIAKLKSGPSQQLAITQFVDELLATPEFGEHLATYWLDLVRFADTVGYHGDQDHNTSPYRNYVIDAFNDNKPFDQFTVEQIAGDLLPNPTEEQILATAYNRLLQTSHEGGVQPKEYLAIYQADRVRNLSAVWMGATVGCAQCHDHKYDPYTAKDFYALAAFFADIDEAQHFKVGTNSLPTRRPPEKPFPSRAEQQLQAFLQKILNSPDIDDERRTALQETIKQSSKTTSVAMYTQAVEPRLVRFLPRGNWLDDSGDIMQPAVPEFLGEVNSDDRPTRLDLARWLVDPENGSGLLTARVMANRFWMRLFGSGLSESVEDFGGQGVAPSNPELLDWLAIEFVNSGWDIKHLMREIILSRTYQQSSLETEWHRHNDPENRLFSRQNRFRLPAEVVRDTALAASGMLVKKIGGPSVKPFQPSGYYRHLNFPTRKYKASDGEALWRRGLYIHWQRQFLHPMLKAFDAPTREECTAKRSESNTPLASLVLLNDKTFLMAADGLAKQVAEKVGDRAQEQRIGFMFKLVTSREPNTQEKQVLGELFDAALMSVKESDSGAEVSDQEEAALATVARAILNLYETYSRE